MNEIKKLNSEQIKAAKHKDGPLLVLSGPGSGKTTVIINRIRCLTQIYGINPNKILSITFTKSAALEMKMRYRSISDGNGAVHFSTFHSLFFRMLREFFGLNLDNVIKENEKCNFIRRAVKDICPECEDIEEMVNTFLLNISLIKNDLRIPEKFEPHDMNKNEFLAIYKVYEAYKERHNKIDFDDMMTGTYNLLKSEPEFLQKQRECYDYILIDEFQDINRVQYECIKMLSFPNNNVFAVGDDDQSIYGFRGASPSFMQNFVNEYKGCDKVYLDKNYRCTDQIIKISEKLIAKNKKRFVKSISGTGSNGQTAQLLINSSSSDEADEIADKICELHDTQGIPYGDMAVIYRNNLSSNAFAHRLILRGIPYYLKDNSYNVYDHWIAKDICAYVNLVFNPHDNDSFFRIVNKPGRMVRKQILLKADTLSGSAFNNVMNAGELNGKARKNMEHLYSIIQIARRKTGFEQLMFIYSGSDYELYLENYSVYKKCSTAFLRQISSEVLSVGKELSDLSMFSDRLAEYSWKIANASVPKRTDDAVTLTTMHSAKGLEFGTVFIPSLVDMVVPSSSAKIRGETEEERRLLYVAMTRAKNRLFLSTYTNSDMGGSVRLSPFLEELGIKIQ